MHPTLTGSTSIIKRIQTGLWTLDHALKNSQGNLGVPCHIIELYGPTNSGKSTLVYSLAGIIANTLQSDIGLADFEGFDAQFLLDVLENVGFDKNIDIVQDKDDEHVLDRLVSGMKNDLFHVGIVDSVGAISPIAETEGSLGEANMGRRAKLMAQFSRKITHALRYEPSVCFLINHVHPNIGSVGTTTTGGNTLKYLSAVRIAIKQKEISPTDEASYQIEGTIKKNRFGYINRTFNAFILAGKGVHRGMTALYDCVSIERAKREKTVKLDGKSVGRMSEFLGAAYAGDEAAFEPFYEVLKTIDDHSSINSMKSEEPEEDNKE